MGLSSFSDDFRFIELNCRIVKRIQSPRRGWVIVNGVGTFGGRFASGFPLLDRGREAQRRGWKLLWSKVNRRPVESAPGLPDSTLDSIVTGIVVEGGKDRDECRKVGYAIGQSPLVKTAVHGADPNWGRVLAAIGTTSAATARRARTPATDRGRRGRASP